MRYLLQGCLFSLLFFLFSCYNPTSREVMHDLKQIEGKWESYKGVSFNENWRFVSDSLIRGEGFSLNGSDTSFFESLRIVKKGDSVYYIVGLAGNKDETKFSLSESSKKEWVFKNPENEFPSIIKYELEHDSLLLITIANIRGNKEQFFYLKKNVAP